MEREQHLERELQREASAERPRFSDARHARIMQAVADAFVVASAARRRAYPVRPRRTLLWVALAASFFVAAFLASRRAREETPVLAVAELRPAITTDDQAIDGIGNVVTVLERALDEISALGQVELFVQIEDPQGEITRSAASREQQAEKTQAGAEVDEETIEQWSDLEGDARLLASLLTGSLPLDLIGERGTSVP